MLKAKKTEEGAEEDFGFFSRTKQRASAELKSNLLPPISSSVSVFATGKQSKNKERKKELILQ